MISAALLRMGLGVGAKMFGKQIAQEAVESGVSSAIGRGVSGRVMNFAAGRAGQQAITKVAGARAASAVTTPIGQKIGTRLITKDVGNRIQAEGQFANATKEVKGAPKVVTQPAPIDPNNMINPPQTAPTVSIADKPPDPGKWGTGPTADIGDRPKTGREMARDWQQARQGRRKQPSTGGGSGWQGTGKGWWQQNEQVSGAGATASPVQLGDYSVERGPARWAMRKPGVTAYNQLKAGTAKGARDALHPAPKPELDPTMIGRQIGVPSMPTTPTAKMPKPSNAPAPQVSFPSTVIPPIPTSGGLKNLKPGTRVGSFQVGTQEVAKATKPAETDEPGLGNWGKQRFKSMMSDAGY